MDTPNRMNGTNGEVKVEDLLADETPMTIGYKPTLPYSLFFNEDGVPQLYALRDIEFMAQHPHAYMAMQYFKAGVFGAEFEIKAENPEVADFVTQTIDRFWSVGVKKVQHGYDYGWIGCEAMYREDSGLIKWDHFIDFAPRDTFVLTKDNEFAGVRVKNVQNRGQVDLWPERENIPAKGFWYAHKPRFNAFYGSSQYSAAWRAWRRLATKDSAEFVVDMSVYRFGVAGPTFRFPPASYRKGVESPLNNTWVSGRDMARQYIEQAKAGAGQALPSTKYPKELGGDYQWSLDWPDHTINVTGILEYIKYLCDEMSYGIGVPPELLQASETGSGYSGRAIPMESFLMAQQQLADAMLEQFIKQILRPLVHFNYGAAKFEAKVASLLKTRQKQGQQQGQPGQPGMPGQAGSGQQPPGQDVGAMPGQDPSQAGAQPGAQPTGQSSGGHSGTVYTGKRGGKGWIDPKGKVHYGEFSLEDISDKIVALAKMSKEDRQSMQARGARLLSLATGQQLEGLDNYLKIRQELVKRARAA